ncbi:capsular biosynthesis protein [Rummeliibacillus sp. JY-2-4R]
MKKICILSTVNFKHMTMISLYTDFLDQNGIPYDVIHIDKYDETETNHAKSVYRFPLRIHRDWPMLKKVMKYYGFRKYAKGIIQQNKYDFIIVWNSYTAFMFADFLAFKYRKRYCLNIRDYNKEKLLPVYLMMKTAIRSATFTTISSDGFKKFLPPLDYVNVYSFNEKMLQSIEPRKSLQNKDEPIRISFIGYVRFYNNDKKLIDALGNDSRFIIQYFGEGAEALEKYAIEKGYRNVKCHGRFDSIDTPKFLAESDIINNLYGIGTLDLDTALSIKLYYAVYLRVPILVYGGTYMDEIASQYHINITVDPQSYDHLGDYIYNSYINKDFSDLKNGCEEYISLVKKSNNHFHELLLKNM